MDVMTTVLTRRSVLRLTEPGPDDGTLLELVEAASTAPDHGRLAPWRLILIRGQGRERLGAALAEGARDRRAHERARGKPLRAPLLVTIVFRPRLPHPKVPEWEQLAATVSLVQTLHLLLHSRGWGVMWRTGTAVDSPAVRECLGISGGERLLGWLYIGTPDRRVAPAPRRRIDVRERVSVLEPGDNSRCLPQQPPRAEDGVHERVLRGRR
ncbi:nitroreductase [Streptomyces sp. 4F14]|uniref:nitroreductase family protein n=1 Tax=Streptomyces sp. 4F14 TaxID=3394380 RepID=UPI003A87A417